jgi:hypothetical protein
MNWREGLSSELEREESCRINLKAFVKFGE